MTPENYNNSLYYIYTAIFQYKTKHPLDLEITRRQKSRNGEKHLEALHAPVLIVDVYIIVARLRPQDPDSPRQRRMETEASWSFCPQGLLHVAMAAGRCHLQYNAHAPSRQTYRAKTSVMAQAIITLRPSFADLFRLFLMFNLRA